MTTQTSRPEPKRLFIKTYGCQMNVYDSERMRDVLRPLGYQPVDTAEHADLVVLNTCHIREKATEKVYSEIGRLRREDGSRPMVAVAGCVAQAEGEEIMARAPYVDIVLGPAVTVPGDPGRDAGETGRRHRDIHVHEVGHDDVGLQLLELSRRVVGGLYNSFFVIFVLETVAIAVHIERRCAVSIGEYVVNGHVLTILGAETLRFPRRADEERGPRAAEGVQLARALHPVVRVHRRHAQVLGQRR